MSYILVMIATFIVTCLFLNWDDIQRNRDTKKKQRNLKRLFNGVPSHTTTIYSFSSLLKFRHFPIYINGELYKLNSLCHCNDQYFGVKDKNNNSFYISMGIKSRKIIDGKCVLDRYFQLGDKPEIGYEIKPSAVIEIY